MIRLPLKDDVLAAMQIRFASMKRLKACALAGVALATALAGPTSATEQAAPAGKPTEQLGSASKLPVPRYVSLKSDRVNVRGGPTRDHDVSFIFTRSGLPVEVTAEFDNWRRIRDWEGSEGWVYHSLLSGKRSARVMMPKQKDALLPCRDSADAKATVTAQLQPGVVGTVKKCNGTWCRFTGAGFDGWVEQDRLWGVYPNEKFD